jgi:hypothetical protein
VPRRLLFLYDERFEFHHGDSAEFNIWHPEERSNDAAEGATEGRAMQLIDDCHRTR